MGLDSSLKIAAIRLAWLFASNAFFPVAISYSMPPNEKMSLRASASFPSNCSGDIYCIVPSNRSLRRQVPADCRGGAHIPLQNLSALRQAKIEQLCARLRQHHIAGLKIAMHNPLTVRFIESVRDLGRISQQIGAGERAFPNPRRERLPLEILHHQILDSVLVANVIERANVRMIQTGDGTCFTLESLAHFRGVCQIFGREF